LTQIKTRTKEQISQQELPYLQESYKLYQQILDTKYCCYDTASTNQEEKEKNIEIFLEKSLLTRLDISTQATDYISSRILLHSDWQKTTMILRPGLESWINQLVSNDPLYLVDENYDLLKPAITQFPPQYQQRLQQYVIRESLDQKILSALPDGQFGLVLAYNYFDHKPFEYIRCYLSEIYVKLKPGGALLMTYNDCDRWPGVLASETRSALYTPGSLILDLASNLGFETISSWHEDGPWTWLELRKPGQWQSIRGGQTLAKILPKPV
jgi:SAM-dependent methyltransferase